MIIVLIDVVPENVNDRRQLQLRPYVLSLTF